MKPQFNSSILRRLIKSPQIRSRFFSSERGDVGAVKNTTGMIAQYPKEFEHIRKRYDDVNSKIPKTDEEIRMYLKFQNYAGGPKGISVEERSHLRVSVRVDADKERHEVLLSKVVNMLIGLSDGQVGKVLHIYPESASLHSIPDIGQVHFFKTSHVIGILTLFINQNKKLEYSGLSAFPSKAPIAFP